MTQPADPVYFLLVDDLEENLLALEALLRRDGLHILKAHSGPEALELLLRYDIALALLDVQMPDMDGFQLAEMMRGTERTRRVPIIFITAGSFDRQRRFRGYEAGAVDFLHKPIEADILRSKADVFFELFRQRQQIAVYSENMKAWAEQNARLLEESRQYADALRDADRRKDEFLATLAHELRNPLAPIRNGLQILRMTPSMDVTVSVRDMMDRQLRHLVRLIDDLLDVSRVSQGKIDLRKEKISLRQTIQSAIEGSQPFIDAGKHRFEAHMPENELWLEADLTRVAQIISNLINNAAKYTPEGGHIRLDARDEDGRAVVSITDNGIGIPAPMLTRVFDLFTQVDNKLEKSRGGLGIGLALVRNLVEMHGGEITADSAGINKGSTFTLRLPLAEPPGDYRNGNSPASLPGAVDASGKPLRVLVVDDNVASAKTIGWMLEMIGHTPILAHDGLAALEIARREHPEVIVLDIGLPGMNGYDVCRELRRDPAFADTVLIAQTGWGQARDRREASEAGFNHHLVKPVDFTKFSNLLTGIGA